MTQDEIIRMAREAGLLAEDEAWVSPYQEAMERFAALVAEATGIEQQREIMRLKAIIEEQANGAQNLVAAHEREKQAEQEPGEWINEDELPEFYPYDDMYQSSKVINGVRMFPNVKVSDRSMFYALTKDHTWISVTETQFNKLKPECRMKCYIAPVRTKDLTDDEIMKINVDTASIVPTCDRQFHFARAVIAADRSKNGTI